MSEPDVYLLGRSKPEQLRLQRQIADLAPVSDAQLAEIGIKPGERVVDIGCGPGGVRHLLAKRIGPGGHVLGLDRSPAFVELARQFVADQASRKSRFARATLTTPACRALRSTARTCVSFSSTSPSLS